MPNALYICLQDDNKIAQFALDDAGRLTPRAEVPLAGGPSVTALSPDGRTLYVGHRIEPAISSFRIGGDGGLTPLGTLATTHGPTFLAPDRTGKYMLSAYYQGGFIAVHPIGANGAVAAATADPIATDNGAHAIATDRSNRFSFVPHIARLNDNVLEPPKNNPGPNLIYQFRFDAAIGRLSPNQPLQLQPPGDRLGPRHYTFHPSLDIAYFSNEQGCSVSAYRIDNASGTLSEVQTVATLPAGFSERNTCSQIHLTPSGRFLYVGNRGHNSIAGFAVDPASGRLTPAGHVPTEAVPSAFALDPDGRFLFAVGTASGRLASYRVDQTTGVLTPLAVQAVGNRPAAVQPVRLA